MSRPVRIALAHWGAELPDWVLALARACETSSQNKVAARLDRSAALVSNVLRKSYSGNMAAVEELVRGVYLAETIACPALGTLPLHECRAWRDKARSFQNTNALRVRMYRACQTCPRFAPAAPGDPQTQTQPLSKGSADD
ncbi:hypothetical protein [Pararhodobacter zhoushanensis]|uniref:Transcriptional regulator n=1 Tax=Pararhodobacter zhoushanensis TaxID=2479545 RepID=A0ABT3H2V3_9RHOB|nr:hypothetical protein [Pararhodobacter zhoushanensis]MCW1934097.1 hypothetical protein [Pararhodobacter zhoushanensis]